MGRDNRRAAALRKRRRQMSVADIVVIAADVAVTAGTGLVVLKAQADRRDGRGRRCPGDPDQGCAAIRRPAASTPGPGCQCGWCSTGARSSPSPSPLIGARVMANAGVTGLEDPSRPQRAAQATLTARARFPLRRRLGEVTDRCALGAAAPAEQPAWRSAALPAPCSSCRPEQNGHDVAKVDYLDLAVGQLCCAPEVF